MKKLSALILAVMMLTTLLGTVAFADGTSFTDTISDGGKYANKDYSGEPLLEISYAGVGMDSNVAKFSQSDAIISTIEDKFNIRFTECTNLGWGEWDENMRIWINSGDTPDMMFYNINYLDLLEYTDQDMLRNIPQEGFAENYPALNSVIEASAINSEFVKRFGGLYVLPHTIFANPPTSPLINHESVVLRKDWLEAIGMEVKGAYTVDELIEYGSKVSAATDLPGAAPGQTFGLDSDKMELFSQLFLVTYNPSYNTFRYDSEKGEYVWGVDDPSSLEGLKEYQKAWKSGLLHREFYVNTNRDPLANLSSGMSGSIITAGTPGFFNTIRKSYADVLGNDPENLVFAAFTGNDGKTHKKEVTNYWGGTIFSPNLSDEKLERLLEMLDWLSTDAGQNMIRMGIYGTDWKYDENGQAKIINATINYPSKTNFLDCIVMCGDGFDLVNPAIPEEIRNATKRIYELKSQGEIVPIDWDLFLFSGTYYDKFSVDYDNELAALVVADGNLETNFNAWVAEKMPVVQKVLDELNTNIKK